MLGRVFTIWTTSLMVTATAHGQLLVPDVTNSRVLLLDDFDGSLIDPSYIELGSTSAFPVNAVRVGDEIWVSDQVNRTIHRFDVDGGHVGDVAGEMDYVRGFHVVGNTIYAANVGQNTGHPERNGIVVIDVPTAEVRDNFSTGSDGQGFGFDVLALVSGETRLLVPDQSSTDEGLDDGEDLDLFRIDGSFDRTFHDSDGVSGIDNPMQVSPSPRGTILAAGFTCPLFGIFEYDASGEQIDFHLIPGTNVFGVRELGDGRLLFTTFDGVFRLDPTDPQPGSNVEPVVAGIVAGFIEPLHGEPTCEGDLDGSGQVDVEDLLVVLSGWGVCGTLCRADMNGDGAVAIADVLAVLGAWGSCP